MLPQNSFHTLCLSSKHSIRVRFWVYHRLGHSTCVKLTRLWWGIGQGNYGITKVGLLSTWINIQVVDIESIRCLGFVVSRTVKNEDSNCIRMFPLKDVNSISHLIK